MVRMLALGGTSTKMLISCTMIAKACAASGNATALHPVTRTGSSLPGCGSQAAYATSMAPASHTASKLVSAL